MKTLVIAAVLGAAVLTTACQPSQTPAAGSSDSVQALETTVTQAVTVTKEYGTQHLGHYLELDQAALRKAGFRPAHGVTVTLYVDHFDVCVTGAVSGQASLTATTAAPDAVPGETCSATKALRTFEVDGARADSRSSALRP